MELLIILGIIVVVAVFGNFKSLSKENSQLKDELAKKRSELYSVNSELAQKTRENQELARTLEAVRNDNVQALKLLARLRDDFISSNVRLTDETNANQKLTTTVESLRTENNTLRKSLSEAPLGFPSLLEAIRLYDEHRDERMFYWLRNKSHPAPTAADIVKLETSKRRDAELEARRSKLLLDYYFSIYPALNQSSFSHHEKHHHSIKSKSLQNVLTASASKILAFRMN